MSSAKIKPAGRDSNLKTAAIKKIKSPSNKAENHPFDAQDSVLPFTYIAPYQEKAGETYMNKKQLAHFKNILTTLASLAWWCPSFMCCREIWTRLPRP